MRYHLESNGYTVMRGTDFIGRVSRRREAYEHSNGRTYRFCGIMAQRIKAKALFCPNKFRPRAGEPL
jgi:hypothetical protein